jgi:hypothetical protein
MKPLCLIALIEVGCGTTSPFAPKIEAKPDLKETIDWMANALANRNGQRIDPTISKEAHFTNTLTADHCNLTYQVSKTETVRYDLSDIDTGTIGTEKIGQNTWVTFKTRDFHHSVKYEHPKEMNWNYDTDSGGFSLDSDEVALSFKKALSRALKLCGGKPSTF